MLELDTNITLYIVVRENSIVERVTVSYSYKKKCILRCRCKKNSISYSIYYYNENYNCRNLSILIDRIEVGLINRLTTPPSFKASFFKY